MAEDPVSRKVNPTNCYVCDSNVDPTCADDYNGAEEYQPNEAHLKNCADVDEATNGCMKVKTQSTILGEETTGLLIFHCQLLIELILFKQDCDCVYIILVRQYESFTENFTIADHGFIIPGISQQTQ